MKVHLHTICWNDRSMMGFFFRHYSPWVDRFFILDDGSNDGSREYLESRDDVVLGKVERIDPSSWVLSAQHIYNNAWKQSVGDADWVVVTNIDEHLYHPEMRRYLASALAKGITVVPSLGYQMLTDGAPDSGSVLCRDYPMGSPWVNMSKLGIFRPDCIVETNFKVGRHRAAFDGEVVSPTKDEVCNLHYKYLGIDETYARHRALEARLGPLDRERNYGHKYRWNKEQLQQDFDDCRASAVDVLSTDPHARHPAPRWWRSDASCPIPVPDEPFRQLSGSESTDGER